MRSAAPARRRRGSRRRRSRILDTGRGYRRSGRNGPAQAEPRAVRAPLPSHACVAGCPSSTVTNAAPGASGASTCSICDSAATRGSPLRRARSAASQPACSRSGLVIGKQPRRRLLGLQFGEGGRGFRRDRSLIADRDARALRRRHDPMRPGDHRVRVERARGLLRSGGSTDAATPTIHPGAACDRRRGAAGSPIRRHAPARSSPAGRRPCRSAAC